jgi:hypothetical protein
MLFVMSCLPTHAQGQVQFSIRQASSAAELRAAGYLRAYCFYHYPPDRSEYSARVREARQQQQQRQRRQQQQQQQWQ